MIEKITKWLPLATFAIVATIALMLVGNQSASLGASGDINTQSVWFVKGLTAGNPKVSVIDSSGNVVAPVTSTTITASGATTVSTFTQGGGNTSTTTTATTGTALASYFDTENLITVTPGGASFTLTLPASSTLSSFIPTQGQVREVIIRNATTTAGILLTIAGGTGTTLKSASSTAIITSNTTGDAYGKIDFLREATGGNIDALITTFNN